MRRNVYLCKQLQHLAFHSFTPSPTLASYPPLRILNRRRDVAQNAAAVGCHPHLFL